MQPWFRFYDDAVIDPKVQLLPAELFKLWVNFLCLANKNNGTLPSIKDIAYSLHETEGSVSSAFQALVEAGLIDKVNATTWAPHNWNGRQFKSDTSTPRVKRFRKRFKQRFSNGDGNVSETPTEREKEREKEKEKTPKKGFSLSPEQQAHAPPSRACAPDGARAPAAFASNGGYTPGGMSPDVGDDYRSPPPYRPEHQHELQPLPDRPQKTNPVIEAIKDENDRPANPTKPWKRLTDEELLALYPKKKPA